MARGMTLCTRPVQMSSYLRDTTLAGKTLLINAAATWCGACVGEHPLFQTLFDKLKRARTSKCSPSTSTRIRRRLRRT